MKYIVIIVISAIGMWLMYGGSAWAAGESPSGSYLSGQFAKSSGDIAGAIRYLEQAHKNAPENDDITSQLEGLLLLEGQAREAMELAGDIMQPNKDPVSTLLVTLRAVKKDDMEKASQLLAPAFETDGGQLWLPLVSAWVDIGRHALAKPLVLEELNVNAGKAAAPIIHYHLALINAQGGFNDAAAVNFKQALESNDEPSPRLMAALLQFYDQNGMPASLKALADSYRPLFADHMAMSDMQPISSPAQGIAEVLLTMGSIMQGAGITQDAVIYLQLALYLRPDFASAAFLLGDAYQELRQYAKANAAYAVVRPNSVLYAKARLRMAMVLDRSNKLPEAIALLDRLSKQPSTAIDAWVAKGDILRMRERFSAAATAYTQALLHIGERQSSHWSIFFARGVCYERRGKWKEAEADLRQALQLQPEKPEVLNYLGYSLLTRGKHMDEARAMIEQAVQVQPNNPQIVDSMGWALYLSGSFDQAAQYLEKAIDLLPGDPTVNDHLGDAYWRLGRKTEARYQWERSLTYSPEVELAAILHKKLKEGLPAPDVAGNMTPLAHAMSDVSPAPMAVAE